MRARGRNLLAINAACPNGMAAIARMSGLIVFLGDQKNG